MVKIPANAAKRIDNHVAKYMGILDIAERPDIKAHDDPGSFWYGRHSKGIQVDEDTGTVVGAVGTLDLQKRIFKHDNFLERVIAHEMIHHRDFIASPLTPEQKEKLQAEIAAGGLWKLAEESEEEEESRDETVPTEADDEADRQGHGPSFWEGAARINAVMGPEFVTLGIESLPEDEEPAETVKVKTSTLVLVGLGVLTAALLIRKRRSATAQKETVPRRSFPGAHGSGAQGGNQAATMSMPPPRQTQSARENERGHYGKR